MKKSRLPAKERRKQIIEKAAEVFAQYGVGGTRTRDIANACDINEALIYRHFSGKEELYREAMVHAYAQTVGQWIAQTSDEKNGLDCIITIVRAQLTTLSENPVLSANMWHGISATTHDNVMKAMAKEQLDKYHIVIRDLIKRGIEDGSIRKVIDPDLGAWFVRGLTWTFILRLVVDLEASDAAKDPDKFCELVTAAFNDCSGE